MKKSNLKKEGKEKKRQKYGSPVYIIWRMWKESIKAGPLTRKEDSYTAPEQP